MAYAKRVALSLVVLAVIVGVVVAIKKPDNQHAKKKQVAASFYPLAYFAQQIGGDSVEVTNITPAGAEPHEYEPTAQDIVTIENSDVLIINGNGLEPWAGSVKNAHTIIAGEGFIGNDPHEWLSPVKAQVMARRIGDILGADPAPLIARLEELDAAYRTGLAHCAKRDIVTSHAAFGYLAKDYGLNQVPITGLSPDEEPSQQQLAQIADFARKNNIKYIFFESLVSPKLAETIAREVGAQTLVLNPIEGLSEDEIKEGKDYFTEMWQNLVNLQLALECSSM